MSLSQNSEEIFRRRFREDTEEEYRLFRMVAPHYDEIENLVARVIREAFRKDSASALTMIELGCGTGITTEIILNADSRIILTAVDNEPLMIDQANHRLRAFVTAGRLTFATADALDYLRAQSDGMSDAILSVLMLHNCPAPYRRNVYEEVRSVLKKDGLFVNVDKYKSDNQAEHEAALNWQIKQFNLFDEAGRPELKAKWTRHYMEDEQPDLLLPEAEYVHDLEMLNFRDIEKIYRCQLEAAYIARK